MVLESFLDDASFYDSKGDEGRINHVGYYHSIDSSELVYFLPKVFMFGNGLMLGKYSTAQLVEGFSGKGIKHMDEYNWIRQLLVIFYNSLIEYRKRKFDQGIARENEIFELNTNVGDKEYTYLDLFLTFTNFHKKNRRVILFRYMNSVSNQADKVNWNRTIQKSLPLINKKGQPVYHMMSSKKKLINYEEELLTIFYSILRHFEKEHKLNFDIDKSFKIEKIDKVKSNGLKRLRNIKHRYFSDLFRRIYQLCELYLSYNSTASVKRKRNEFITVRNYNLVFEDMVDKLLSDDIDDRYKTVDGVDIPSLKNNKDGKIIDHLFEHASLIDRDDTIFYIGDSKYYKTGSGAGEMSRYKQFTYAKNIVQFNIDLLNKRETYTTRMRYRDDVTEGYNITPNFFIYGYVDSDLDFENPHIKPKDKDKVVKSYHWEDRLFDRDTLFVRQYDMNFLYVLKGYTSSISTEISQLRSQVKDLFRNDFVEYFSSNECGYEFKYRDFSSREDLKTFVNAHFRLLNGKCYSKDNRLFLAKHMGETKLDGILEGFSRYDLI